MRCAFCAFRKSPFAPLCTHGQVDKREMYQIMPEPEGAGKTKRTKGRIAWKFDLHDAAGPWEDRAGSLMVRTWGSSARYCGLLIVLARVDPSNEHANRQMSFLGLCVYACPRRLGYLHFIHCSRQLLRCL